MNTFDYVRPAQLEQAFSARKADSAYLAGGTTLIDLMKEDVEHPSTLIDINALPWKQIEERSGAIWIGALVTNSALAENPLILKRYPFLAEALLSGASQQLRNAATVGGNVLQRTRCPYFRDISAHCNKRTPDAGCDAIEGYNRSHAILGTSESCIATHPSDMCVPLVALDARIHLAGAKGVRSVGMDEFYRLPQSTPHIENVLTDGEVITHVELPDLPMAVKSRYLKVRDRSSYEFALASAAVTAELGAEKKVKAIRIAFGGVATKPWRARKAEAALMNSELSEESATRAADEELAGAKGHTFNAFKIELMKRILVRALAELKEVL